jgi:hypothetical protein
MHRTIGVDGAPDSVRVSDGQSGARMTEEQYRVGAHLPEFDSLPVLVVQRIPVTDIDDPCEDDKRFIDEWSKKNAARP